MVQMPGVQFLSNVPALAAASTESATPTAHPAPATGTAATAKLAEPLYHGRDNNPDQRVPR